MVLPLIIPQLCFQTAVLLDFLVRYTCRIQCRRTSTDPLNVQSLLIAWDDIWALVSLVPSILYTALWSFAISTQQDSPDTSRQLLYASRVLLQVALSCTQLSQASLCNRFGWDGRRSNVSILMNASLGLLATIVVSLPPLDEVRLTHANILIAAVACNEASPATILIYLTFKAARRKGADRIKFWVLWSIRPLAFILAASLGACYQRIIWPQQSIQIHLCQQSFLFVCSIVTRGLGSASAVMQLLRQKRSEAFKRSNTTQLSIWNTYGSSTALAPPPYLTREDASGTVASAQTPPNTGTSASDDSVTHPEQSAIVDSETTRARRWILEASAQESIVPGPDHANSNSLVSVVLLGAKRTTESDCTRWYYLTKPEDMTIDSSIGLDDFQTRHGEILEMIKLERHWYVKYLPVWSPCEQIPELWRRMIWMKIGTRLWELNTMDDFTWDGDMCANSSQDYTRHTCVDSRCTQCQAV